MSEPADEEVEVRKFIRYEANVGHISQAWTVIMTHVDEFLTPNVEITAVMETTFADSEDEEDVDVVSFDVSVYGDVSGGI